MSKVYRVGAIGFAHMHTNHLLDEFKKLPKSSVPPCESTPGRTAVSRPHTLSRKAYWNTIRGRHGR